MWDDQRLSKASTWICLEISPYLVIARSSIHIRKKSWIYFLPLFQKRQNLEDFFFAFWLPGIHFPSVTFPDLRFHLKNYLHPDLVGRLCRTVNLSASPSHGHISPTTHIPLTLTPTPGNQRHFLPKVLLIATTTIP